MNSEQHNLMSQFADNVSRTVNGVKKNLSHQASHLARAGKNFAGEAAEAGEIAKERLGQEARSVARRVESAYDQATGHPAVVTTRQPVVTTSGAPVVLRQPVTVSAQPPKETFTDLLKSAKHAISSQAKQAEHDISQNAMVHKISHNAKNLLNSAKLALASGAKHVASGMSKAEQTLRRSASE